MRTEVTRTERHSTVTGWELAGGEMVPRSYDYPRVFPSAEAVERVTKRDHPYFVPVECSEYTVRYTMPVDQFRELANVEIIEN